MVQTRNQQGGHLSPAKPGCPTTTTGGFAPAVLCSNVTMGVTAAGDVVTTSSKTAIGGLLSSQPGGVFVGTSSTEANVHSPTSDGATPGTRVTSYDAGTRH